MMQGAIVYWGSNLILAFLLILLRFFEDERTTSQRDAIQKLMKRIDKNRPPTE